MKDSVVFLLVESTLLSTSVHLYTNNFKYIHTFFFAYIYTFMSDKIKMIYDTNAKSF